LHNIYPTMKLLHKWGIKESDKCANCDVVETIKHAIFECPIAIDAINKLENFLTLKIGKNVKFAFNDVLLGVVSDAWQFSKSERIMLDYCLIMLKQKLILQRENKSIMSQDFIEKLCKDRARMEIYNVKKYKKDKGEVFWSMLQ
jgi:hypothetical protein